MLFKIELGNIFALIYLYYIIIIFAQDVKIHVQHKYTIYMHNIYIIICILQLNANLVYLFLLKYWINIPIFKSGIFCDVRHEKPVILLHLLFHYLFLSFFFASETIIIVVIGTAKQFAYHCRKPLPKNNVRITKNPFDVCIICILIVYLIASTVFIFLSVVTTTASPRNLYRNGIH